jgi:hypothetical protein
MVHRPPELGMRMQHNADRGILLPGGMISAFDAPGCAGKDDFGHEWRNLEWLAYRDVSPGVLDAAAECT